MGDRTAVIGAIEQRLRRLSRRLYRHSVPSLSAAAALSRRTLLAKVRLVAVVGSIGKTTTARLVGAALGLERAPSGFNAGGAIALAVLRTPPWRRHAVVEIGIDGFGQMARHTAILRPDVVIVTGIASDHNATFRTLEATREEKAKVFSSLRPGGVAVMNGDDPHVRLMRRHAPGRVVAYGFEAGNDVRVVACELDFPHGTRLTVDVMGCKVELRTRMVGRIMAYPVAAALAMAAIEGRDLDASARALEAVEPVWGRLQIVGTPDGAWLIRDEYKGKLEGYLAALGLLASVPGRRLAVCGEVEEPPYGQRAVYRDLGALLAAATPELAVFLGSRTAFQRYRAGAMRSGMADDRLVHAGNDTQEATRLIRARLAPGAVVLLKGRREQRLDRVALALLGQPVSCRLPRCPGPPVACHLCPLLTAGEEGSRP